MILPDTEAGWMKRKSIDRVKLHGIQYTPPELASFLAERMLECGKPLTITSVLDPACGDGGLLEAFVSAFPAKARKKLVLTGYETDPAAIDAARSRLASLGVRQVILHQKDFLTTEGVETIETPLFGKFVNDGATYDAIISNPPYVRTQILGSRRAQELSLRFGITGRVDLYHAFAIAMASVLKDGGVLGLLTSNRFLSVKSGQSLRRMLSETFSIRHVYDLGDTKLFSAAVLPAIVIATKGADATATGTYDRVYECRSNGCDHASAISHSSILAALTDRANEGVIRTPELYYKVERGALRTDRSGGAWSLATDATDSWLATVQENQSFTFGDIANVKVGIKTTADEVFLRSDWDSLPVNQMPEESLIHPLITHYEASRWHAVESGRSKQVLYPHENTHGKRRAIDITRFPKAARYLEVNRQRLEGREYVIKAGRKWYEIWVPHDPDEWAKPKMVWPDISEEPRFFMDQTGALVNGDCYWITLKESVAPEWLYLMLGVANSTLAVRFYDTVFHNKLYSGRRRFMTQYVSKFPLPHLENPLSKQIVAKTMKLVQGSGVRGKLESEVNELVWRSFGLGKEV